MRKRVRSPKQKPIEILFSKTRRDVLASFFLQPDRWWYLSELAQHLELRPSSLQIELPELESGEFLISKKNGNRIYYKANSDSLLFHELQQILIKTVGFLAVLKEVLQPFEKKIIVAFIYGSIARGEEVSTSDVDLMVIGDIRLSSLIKDLKKAEEQIERPINPTIYQPTEFQKKIQEKNNFLSTVRSEKKLFIIGNTNDLDRLAK